MSSSLCARCKGTKKYYGKGLVVKECELCLEPKTDEIESEAATLENSTQDTEKRRRGRPKKVTA